VTDRVRWTVACLGRRFILQTVLHSVLIVPGYLGSGPSHWQSWLQAQLPDSKRIQHIDWGSPILARWASAVRDQIDRARGVVWLVAHSFGCLATAIAASERPGRVAGALLVAPANPERFSPVGLRHAMDLASSESVASWLPDKPLPCPSVLVASVDDPWLGFAKAGYLASRWGSLLVNAGRSGHINAESGFGPWPDGLKMLLTLQRAQGSLPLGSIDIEATRREGGTTSVLSRLRRRTRLHQDIDSQSLTQQ
jgi:uncharacterized protein